MKAFMTGGTGFVGSAVVPELVKHGHQVIGLARSDSAAKWLESVGAEAHRGDLEDLNSLRSGAESAEAVIHAGFIHDFTRFAEVCEIERKAVEAIGSVLVGSDRPFLITSGTALKSPGRLATEESDTDPSIKNFPRYVTTQAAEALQDKGAKVITVALSPSVHGIGDKSGFVPTLVNIAREKGVSAYIGEGKNRWTAVHQQDVGPLYRLALERGEAGKSYFAVAEEEIYLRDIAISIGKGLNLPVVSVTPEEAPEHFGWFAMFASLDCPASSKLTQERLGWKPEHQTLLEDLEKGTYF